MIVTMLQVYILFCLQDPNSHSPLFGLVAVRLASLNQTINPWIYVILRKSLLSRLRQLCKGCLPCREDSAPPLHVPRKPTQYPRVHNNYVHVRHQLCPSSQYVGQNSTDPAVKDAGRGRGGGKRSKGSGSATSSRGREGEVSGNYWRYCSETGGEWRAGSSSGDLCSICRARLAAGGSGGNSSVVSATNTSHHHPHSPTMTSQACSAVCDGSTEAGENGFPANYVSLFRHVRRASGADSDSDCPDGPPVTVSGKTSCRYQAGRGPPAAGEMASGRPTQLRQRGG